MKRVKAYHEDGHTDIFEYPNNEAVASFLRELDSLAETVGAAEEQLRKLASKLSQHLEFVSEKAFIPRSKDVKHPSCESGQKCSLHWRAR